MDGEEIVIMDIMVGGDITIIGMDITTAIGMDITMVTGMDTMRDYIMELLIRITSTAWTLTVITMDQEVVKTMDI
jgi:hypothetical protein